MFMGIWCAVAVSLWFTRWAEGADGLVCPQDTPEGGRNHCTANEPQDTTQIFYIDEYKLTVTFKEDDHLYLQCERNLTLDNPALPRFRILQRLRNIKLINCSLPAHTYKEALDTLNVHVLQHLEIEDLGELKAHHLSGLECSTGTRRCDTHRLEALALVKLQLSLNVFEAVPNLQRLRLEETHFDRLDLLPGTLKELHLTNANIRNLTLSILSHFTRLGMLTVRDDEGPLSVKASDTIEQLSLEAEALFIDITSLPNLKELKVAGWQEPKPKRFKSCGALQSLVLVNITAELLPDDWLLECHSLTSLLVEEAPFLTNMSRYALRGALELTTLELMETALESLPQGLLDDATKLKTVNLSSNKLTSLPSSLFVRSHALHSLNLNDNKLRGDVFSLLGALYSLRELHLGDNPGLGDSCNDHADDHSRISKLQSLQKIRILVLRNTNATMMCRDWYTDMPRLTELDLAENRITQLSFSDMQFTGENRPEVIVDLSDNPVKSLHYTKNEYHKVINYYNEYCSFGGRYVSHARIKLSSVLDCDCNVFWAAKTIQKCPSNVIIEQAKCFGQEIGNVILKKLTCPANCNLPADCKCARRDGDSGEVRSVTCYNRTNFPKLPIMSGVFWELNLSNNFIKELDAKDLSPNIQELDLRHNKLTHLSTEVLHVLPRGANLSLEGNKLRCDCNIAETLKANFTIDLPQLLPPICLPCHADSTLFANSTILPSLLVPLLVTAGLVILCLSFPLIRRRVKKLIRDYFCPRPEPSNDLNYDVFLSYSHLDGELVEELMKWLEKNEYRVCEHSRDWAPGAWIPAQITASVQRSRCTLVVVSKNFLHSKWARAEFREAYVAALHDTQPRLVVVLLEEPGNLELDKELRHYVKNNTYALWSDRYFWSKLRTALPKPRPCEQITIESELAPTLGKEETLP